MREWWNWKEKLHPIITVFWLRFLWFWTRLQNFGWDSKDVLTPKDTCACASHSISAQGTNVSSVCSVSYLDITKKARKSLLLQMHRICCMGAVHLPTISGHSGTQLELYQNAKYLQVPTERPDFSFSPRWYFRQKKRICWGEPEHTLLLAKLLVQIQNLKSAGVRCVCTPGNPIKCLFTFSGT